ncbi:ABC transporter ATP-binding protein [Tistrella bauzanensis]|uniref:ABC transporter ATP-binding protein n=2 Tax=Tistrella bauzanensis TaxID=657419 RepID=A0ABQ1IGH3_9PROT|nr:ABC transporter ATP-binding protein [Tistrella bauzanensis]
MTAPTLVREAAGPADLPRADAGPAMSTDPSDAAARSRTGAPPLLVCDRIDRSFGGLKALKSVSIAISPGQIFGLVGPNGSGKTTMVNAITGFYPPDAGRVMFDGRDLKGLKPHRIAQLGIARTFQNLALFRGMSVLDNILVGRHIHMRPGALKSLFYPVWARPAEIRHRRHVEDIIDFLQLQDVRDMAVEVIPLGLQKRVELARALAAEPRLLVLDEPMAGMNQEEKEYMARFILDARDAFGAAVLLIEHHMDVVTALCDRLLVLSYGEPIAEGDPHAVIAEPAVVAAYLGKGRTRAA